MYKYCTRPISKHLYLSILWIRKTKSSKKDWIHKCYVSSIYKACLSVCLFVCLSVCLFSPEIISRWNCLKGLVNIGNTNINKEYTNITNKHTDTHTFFSFPIILKEKEKADHILEMPGLGECLKNRKCWSRLTIKCCKIFQRSMTTLIRLSSVKFLGFVLCGYSNMKEEMF